MKRFLIVWAVVSGIFLYFLGETAGKVSFSTLLLSLPGTAVFALIITKLLKPRPEEKELEKQWILKKENIEKKEFEEIIQKRNSNKKKFLFDPHYDHIPGNVYYVPINEDDDL